MRKNLILLVTGDPATNPESGRVSSRVGEKQTLNILVPEPVLTTAAMQRSGIVRKWLTGNYVGNCGVT